jgi:hypothetical protein
MVKGLPKTSKAQHPPNPDPVPFTASHSTDYVGGCKSWHDVPATSSSQYPPPVNGAYSDLEVSRQSVVPKVRLLLHLEGIFMDAGHNTLPPLDLHFIFGILTCVLACEAAWDLP